jgi:hypothetical protein
MRTNTAAQQTTRRMTSAAKAAMMAERIAADHAANEAHAARFNATSAMWTAAYAAGLTPAELHALDMALARGADPDYLTTTF